MFEPKKVVALAKPGQVAGYGRLISTRAPDPHYAEAAKVAYGNPGHPVIVHEFKLLEGVDDPELNAYVYAEVRAALRTLNEADAHGRLDLETEGVGVSLYDGPERFQVSSTRSKGEGVLRTWIVFHPEGRPVRNRKKADPTT